MSNLFNELDSLNANLGVNSSVSKKYDYEAANIAKVQQKQFRVKVRKSTEQVYSLENVELETLKKFASFQEQILIVCTKGKKKFAQLQVSEVYPNFSSLSANEKKSVETNHKKFVSMLSEKKEEKKEVLKK
jgi:hypothetical protein